MTPRRTSRWRTSSRHAVHLPGFPLASLATLVLLLGIATLPLAAQPPAAPTADAVSSEELAEPEMALVPLGEPSPVDAETAAAFAAAEARFNSADQPTSIPLLTELIDRLEPMATVGHPDDEAKDLLARALVLRAETRFNLGQTEEVDRDLERSIQVRPERDLDRELTSPKLIQRFDALRRRLLGFITASIVDPPDLVLRIDGRRADPRAGPMPALAGPRRIVAQRIGYAPWVGELEVEAGDTVAIELVLERIAPVLRLTTRPAGATVVIDGVARGTTSGVAAPDFVPAGAAARFLREEFSARFELADLTLGEHLLEVRQRGYRPYQATLSMLDAIDYEMPPIVLERERGTLLLRDLPGDAQVQVDGTDIAIERRGARARIPVAPGEHRLLVIQGPARMFARQLRVADRQTVEVGVDLKPGLGLLGVLGGDRDAAQVLGERLRRALGKGRFTAIEHQTDDVRSALGLDALTLRAANPRIEWRRVQREMAQRFPAMVYVLAVLSDDLLATHAELFLWSQAPAPPVPDRLRIALDDPAALDPLAGALNRSLRIRRAWLGALLIDGAENHPVVAQITAGGPASALAVGDQVLSLDGQALAAVHQLKARVRGAEIGESLRLRIERGGATQEIRLTLGSSPQVLAGEEGLLSAAVFADLALLEARVAPEDRWLVRLNRAKALLDAGEWVDAARELRAIKAPADAPGVGRGTVDYWLGVALNGAGSSYTESARAAFNRAASAPDARLFHDDGPWVAPRARVRLDSLEATSTPTQTSGAQQQP